MRYELRRQRDAIARSLRQADPELKWRDAVVLATAALPRCGAKTKAGTPCQRKALPNGNGRCIKHRGGVYERTPEHRAARRELAKRQPRDGRGWFIKLQAAE
jgi:hypothetical protein